MLMPSLPRIGTRDSVLAALDSLNSVTNRTLSWRPIRAETSADGTRGYTYGYGRRVARSDTLTSVVPIQYLSFWRREADQWKLVAWLISAGGADAPAAAPEACAHPGPPEYVASNDSTAIATVRAADLDFSARSQKSGAGACLQRVRRAQWRTDRHRKKRDHLRPRCGCPRGRPTRPRRAHLGAARRRRRTVRRSRVHIRRRDHPHRQRHVVQQLSHGVEAPGRRQMALRCRWRKLGARRPERAERSRASRCTRHESARGGSLITRNRIVIARVPRTDRYCSASCRVKARALQR